MIAVTEAKEKEAEIELLKQGRNYANKSPNEDIKAITQAADLPKNFKTMLFCT